MSKFSDVLCEYGGDLGTEQVPYLEEGAMVIELIRRKVRNEAHAQTFSSNYLWG